MSSSNPGPDSSGTWYGRSFIGFVVGALPTFFTVLFYPPEETLIFSSIAAIVVGSIFGVLAAVLGKRMLGFLMNIPW